MRPTSALATFFCLLSLSAAAEAAQRQRFDLRGGRVDQAAIALARQARISIGIRDPSLAGRKTNSVRGSYSVEQALAKMLSGTGVRAVPLGPSAYLLVAAPRPIALASVKRPPKIRRPTATPSPRPTEPAAEAEDPADIVVTGSKRRTLLAAYPGSASIVGGEELEIWGLDGSEALAAHVPAVTSTHLGPGRNKLFLRGIADSSFNGPTQATVGQYLGETRLNYNAPDPDLRLHDMERVEVLPGPHGTLYGAGSLGGIIRAVPNRPRLDDYEGAASLGASLTQHGEPGGDAAGMLNIPLVPNHLGLRLVGYAETEGGYIDDIGRDLEDVNRTRIYGGRAALRAEQDDWTVDLGLTGQRIRGEDAQFADRDGPPLTRRSQVQQDFRNGYLLADLVVSRSWNDLRLVTSTGFVRQTLLERYDSSREDGPPLLFEQRNRTNMLSAETRLSKDGHDGFGWILGASFIRNSSKQERALGQPAAPSPITGVRNSVSEATGFAEGTLAVSTKLSITAGLRLTHSRLSGTALDVPAIAIPLLTGLEASRAETSLLPSFALTARPNDDLTLFLRYQEGFRPGGLAVTGQIVQRFRNDRVASIEGGLRYRHFGPVPLDLGAALSFTRWQDIQADIIDLSGFPTTQNIGDGRIISADIRAGWRPVTGLSLDAGAVLNWSRVTNPAPTLLITPSGRLPNVARLNARLAADYHAGVFANADLHLSAAARYVGKSRLGIGPILGEVQGDWLDTRIGARLQTGRHSFSLSLSNLLDEDGNRFALGSPFTLVERKQVTPLRPRSVRVGWDVRF